MDVQAFLLDSSNEKGFRNLAVSEACDSWGLVGPDDVFT
jgi:hypothetical protein